MPEPQSFKNHGRADAPQHFFAMPVLLINFIVVIVICVQNALRHGTHHLAIHIWLVVVSLALVVLGVNMRIKDLKVQDRVIRLEERLRYAALLPPAKLAESAALTIPQIVALRFASDAELPALVSRAAAEQLTPKQIKQSIATWRPDNHRV